MSAASKILRRSTDATRSYLSFWCPGCDTPHQIAVGDGTGPRWGWNGDVHKPTFTPSILVTFGRRDGNDWHCHSYVTDGLIDFLADSSAHQLRGPHPIPDWPHEDWGGSEPATN